MSLSSLTFTAVFAVTFLFLIIGMYRDDGLMELKNKMVDVLSHRHRHRHRRLLNDVAGKRERDVSVAVAPKRIIRSKRCLKSDIVVSQGATKPLPNGIPTFTVEIMNTCVSGCNITRIHLSCGWFSSARLVNPRVFKRLRVGDCLVNNGKPLLNGRTLSFKYANTFRYPLFVSSVTCTT